MHLLLSDAHRVYELFKIYSALIYDDKCQGDILRYWYI